MGSHEVITLHDHGTYSRQNAKQKYSIQNYLEAKDKAWLIEYGSSGYYRQFGRPFVESIEDLKARIPDESPKSLLSPGSHSGILTCEHDALSISVYDDEDSTVANDLSAQKMVMDRLTQIGNDNAIQDYKKKQKGGSVVGTAQTLMVIAILVTALAVCGFAIPGLIENFDSFSLTGGGS